MSRRTDLPAIPEEQHAAVNAVREILEVGTGVRGERLDKFVTFRDLTLAGFGVEMVNGQPSLGGAGGVDLFGPGAGIPGEPGGFMDIGAGDPTRPPAPRDVRARGLSMSAIGIQWAEPGYHNHAYAEVFASMSDNWSAIRGTFDASKRISAGNRTPYFMGYSRGTTFLHTDLQATIPVLNEEYVISLIQLSDGVNAVPEGQTRVFLGAPDIEVGDTVFMASDERWSNNGLSGEVVAVGEGYVDLGAEFRTDAVVPTAFAGVYRDRDELNEALNPRPVYYWVRFVSTAGVSGPVQSDAGIQGTVFIDPSQVLNILTGMIRRTQLANDLLRPIETTEQSIVTRVGRNDDGIWTVAGFGIGLEEDEDGELISTFAVAADQFAIMGAGNDGRRVVSIEGSGGEFIVTHEGPATEWGAEKHVVLSVPPGEEEWKTIARGATFYVTSTTIDTVRMKVVTPDGEPSPMYGELDMSSSFALADVSTEGVAIFPENNIPFIVNTKSDPPVVGIRGKLVIDGMMVAREAQIEELAATTVWSQNLTNFGLLNSKSIVGEVIATQRSGGWAMRMKAPDFSGPNQRVLEFGRFLNPADEEDLFDGLPLVNPNDPSEGFLPVDNWKEYPQLSRTSQDTAFAIGTKTVQVPGLVGNSAWPDLDGQKPGAPWTPEPSLKVPSAQPVPPPVRIIASMANFGTKNELFASAESPYATPVSYSWDTGDDFTGWWSDDGSTWNDASATPPPDVSWLSYRYAVNGTYTLTLTVGFEDGATASVSCEIDTTLMDVDQSSPEQPPPTGNDFTLEVDGEIEDWVDSGASVVLNSTDGEAFYFRILAVDPTVGTLSVTQTGVLSKTVTDTLEIGNDTYNSEAGTLRPLENADADLYDLQSPNLDYNADARRHPYAPRWVSKISLDEDVDGKATADVALLGPHFVGQDVTYTDASGTGSAPEGLLGTDDYFTVLFNKNSLTVEEEAIEKAIFKYDGVGNLMIAGTAGEFMDTPDVDPAGLALPTTLTYTNRECLLVPITDVSFAVGMMADTYGYDLEFPTQSIIHGINSDAPDGGIVAFGYLKGSLTVGGGSRIYTDPYGDATHFVQMDSEFPLMVMGTDDVPAGVVDTLADWDQWSYDDALRAHIRGTALFWVSKSGQAGFNTTSEAIFINDSPLEPPAGGVTISAIARYDNGAYTSDARVWVQMTFDQTCNKFAHDWHIGVAYHLFLVPYDTSSPEVAGIVQNLPSDRVGLTMPDGNPIGFTLTSNDDLCMLIIRASDSGLSHDGVTYSCPGERAFHQWMENRGTLYRVEHAYSASPPDFRALSGAVEVPPGQYKALLVAVEMYDHNGNDVYGAIDPDTNPGSAAVISNSRVFSQQVSVTGNPIWAYTERGERRFLYDTMIPGDGPVFRYSPGEVGYFVLTPYPLGVRNQLEFFEDHVQVYPNTLLSPDHGFAQGTRVRVETPMVDEAWAGTLHDMEFYVGREDRLYPVNSETFTPSVIESENTDHIRFVHAGLSEEKRVLTPATISWSDTTARLWLSAADKATSPWPEGLSVSASASDEPWAEAFNSVTDWQTASPTGSEDIMLIGSAPAQWPTDTEGAELPRTTGGDVDGSAVSATLTGNALPVNDVLSVTEVEAPDGGTDKLLFTTASNSVTVPHGSYLVFLAGQTDPLSGQAFTVRSKTSTSIGVDCGIREWPYSNYTETFEHATATVRVPYQD